ncbi:MAG: hypothetical protein ACE5HC_11400 [Candidatus Binatia bacterium]
MRVSKTQCLLIALAVTVVTSPAFSKEKGKGRGKRAGTAHHVARQEGHLPFFVPGERRIIREFFLGHSSGLPPGLAKRGGNLPPGLQKHLERNGTLPPGLQKRLEPFPSDLERRLSGIPNSWRRVILGRDVILLDRRTGRILDIIEDVIGLIRDR